MDSQFGRNTVLTNRIPQQSPELSDDAFGQLEFTNVIREWAQGSQSQNNISQHLISFRSAIDLVKGAIEKAKPKIDIPLVSPLAILGLKKELEEFSLSITGSAIFQSLRPLIMAC